MRIVSLKLSNFRSFGKAQFEFSPLTTVIVGPNASGKSNLLEAVALLSSGHSLHSSRESDLIFSQREFALVEGNVEGSDGQMKDLTIQIRRALGAKAAKNFKVNGVGRALLNFAGNFAAVIFRPEDIQLTFGPPDLRRSYINSVLSTVDRTYRRGILDFDKVRRNRNRVLEGIRDGEAKVGDLEFWDEKLLELFPVISETRIGFFDFLSRNSGNLMFSYHPSFLTSARLSEYREREIAAATTLIGPHRDDFTFEAKEWGDQVNGRRDLAVFGSRGEQRMAVFSLKMLEIAFLEMKLGSRPVLLLDDVFSELDEIHRHQILQRLGAYQCILTTTEEKFIDPSLLAQGKLIKIG